MVLDVLSSRGIMGPLFAVGTAVTAGTGATDTGAGAASGPNIVDVAVAVWGRLEDANVVVC